jgi:hypothetical protein
MTWRTFFDAVIMAKAKRRSLPLPEAPPFPPRSQCDGACGSRGGRCACANRSRNGRFALGLLNPAAGPDETLNGSRLGLYILGGGSGDDSLLRFPLRFSQPERFSQRKGNRLPSPFRRHPFCSVMADRVTIISSRDPWPFSTVTAGDLEDLVAEGLLRPLLDEKRPEWIPPASGAALSPPPGYVVSFVSFHERGFGVPASRFMRAILHNCGVELHNLSPNSISQAAIFVAVCKGYLGIAPHWDLWTHLFSVELFASPTGERRVRAAVRAGGCILQLRQSRALLYIPAILASSNKGWQRRWFYLRNDGKMLPPFSQRVVTVAADAWRHGTPHDRQKNLEPLLKALEALRKGGLTAAGVIAAIHRRRVLPLAERCLPLWEMTPEADLEGSRMSSDPLPVDVLHGRVVVALGKPDASALSQPLMRPDQGCVPLVSARSFLPLASGCPWFLQSGFPSVSRR